MLAFIFGLHTYVLLCFAISWYFPNFDKLTDGFYYNFEIKKI